MGGSILLALLIGGLLGCITALFVVKFKFHSLITTIAVSTIAKSVAAAIYQGMPLPVPVIKSTGIYSFINSDLFGIPMIFIIAIVLYVGSYFLQEKTKFGQYIYALGENRQAVRETGIKDHRILASIFVTSAIFAALGGILMVFTVYGSGQPKMGSSFFLDGFTTVFLGAMFIKLGKTNVVGTFFGALLLAILVNGLTMMGSSFATSQIIKGLLLVLGVIVVSVAQKRKRGKIGVLKYE
jgi:ribose/xylose/arabinose/galactoside ABC-type transport system permease subunit